MFRWSELKNILYIEQLDTYLFRGHSISLGLEKVFGGQVLAQSLNAAYRSVPPERVPHSMHAYFLRPGHFDRPIIYEVDPIRDGGSFMTRRIVARQNGEAIFNASVSFQVPEQGPAHQISMPEDIPPPDDFVPDAERFAEIIKTLPQDMAERLTTRWLVMPGDVMDVRSPFPNNILNPRALPPRSGYWFRIVPDVGDDPVMHLTLLAYLSDRGLMATGIRPHMETLPDPRHIMMASLDHAMWFHDDVNVNDWIYYHIDSPISGHSRTFNRGSFYTREGRLIASTAQEGLFRQRRS